MEKLIELLSEYDEYRGEKRRDYGWTKDKVELDVKMIIFKKFGFIKWLVENDKIDRDIMEGKMLYYYLEKSENMHGDKNFSRCERLLMLLSISDTPIEDLCGYLKDDATEKVDTLLNGAKKTCENIGI